MSHDMHDNRYLIFDHREDEPTHDDEPTQAQVIGLHVRHKLFRLSVFLRKFLTFKLYFFDKLHIKLFVTFC